ncbi:MAG TPA: S8 family serine peptidase [Dyella sp.]|uniref:S8 family serine peptidase n=1 Tax=Dyella sp. TaxID=1869338 RepID=UPI002D77B48E|nr:S8 family serine peptidase [Dyella sp.]HET6552810.1 S8 family serine peptidase [Dyella sp.]
MNRSQYLCLTALAAAIGFASAHAADTTVSADVTAKINTRTMQKTTQFDRFIITYRNGTTERSSATAATQNVTAAVSRAKLHASANATAGSALGVTWKRKLAIGSDLVRTSRKLDRNEALTLMQQIATDPAVAAVEPDVMLHAVKDYVAPASASPGGSAPNDTNFPLQWHMRPGNGTVEKVGRDTTSFANWGGSGASSAWPNYDGSGVTVAVIDTGVIIHGDLNEDYAGAGYDMINDSFVSGRAADGRSPGGWDLGDWTNTEPYITECLDGNASAGEASSWHGSHVFGNIAAVNNNGTGVDGIATHAKVIPIRALGHCGGYTSDIADSITWASGGHVDGIPDNPNPAQVISMSLGGDGTCLASDVSGTAIAGAMARGATVVVAAGNDSEDASSHTPASCPGVVAVASVGITGKRAFYSNYGSTVTVAAPGGGIYANDASSGTQVDAGFVWSTVSSSTTTPDQGTSVTGGMAGTSQATPHVSGIVALMIEAVNEAGHATLTPDQIRLALVNSARNFPNTPDHPIGAGIVDANAAISAAINYNSVAPSIALTSGVAAIASGKAGDAILYRIDVPTGATNLTLRTLGGTGDVSLFAKRGNPPSNDGGNADFKSVKPGNSESIVQTTVSPGSWYVLVVGVKDFANVQVLANYTAH